MVVYQPAYQTKSHRELFAILSGAALILYSLPYLFFGIEMLPEVFRSFASLKTLLEFAEGFFLPVAGILLIVQKPKIAAIFVFLAAASVMLFNLPTIPGYLDGTHYDLPSPAFYVLIPILLSLSPLLLGVGMLLRRIAGFILCILSAISFFAASRLIEDAFAYHSGHPSPLNLLLPLFFCAGSVLAGISFLIKSPVNNVPPGFQ